MNNMMKMRWYGSCWNPVCCTSWSCSRTPATIPSTYDNSQYSHILQHPYHNNTAKTTISVFYLIEKVNLGDSVGSITRMLDQEGYEPDKGIQGVETFGPDQRGTVALLSQSPVAQVYTHLCAQSEEPGDKVVCL